MAGYGLGGVSMNRPVPYTPEQERARAEQEERDAYTRWIQEQQLLMQLAEMAQNNRNQGVYNANTLAQQRQSNQALAYGLGQDIFSQQMGLARGNVDIAQMQNQQKQQAEQNRRYGYGLELDLAQAKNRPQEGYGLRASRMFR